MGERSTHPPPRRVGSFQVVDEIGQGGMGVVYLARQPTLERAVALKRIRRELLADPAMVERFQREARAAAAVHHQNVVAVYDCFAHRGDHYIAQEYVDGSDLRTVLDRVGTLPPRIAGLVALEVARGLEEIHARGIVHRDLKPHNVLIGRGGAAKIADFGIALEADAGGLTRPGTLMGSLPYLSPEQLLGERVDPRSDLFLFGILLYEMLVGEPPFLESEDGAEDTLLERMQAGRYVAAHRRARGVPWWLNRVIARCLRGRPARRVASAWAVRRRLERGLGRVSPADGRREIAAWLWDHGVFAAEGERTAVPAVVGAVPDGGLVARLSRMPAWVAPAALAVAVIAAGVAAEGFGVLPEPARPAADAGPEPAAPAVSAPAPEPVDPSTDDAETPAAPAPAPALVRFAAWPWAEVRIAGGPTFLTPRAAPIVLSPGEHRAVFEHPTFGRYEVAFAVEPGEERLVRHDFAPEATP